MADGLNGIKISEVAGEVRYSGISLVTMSSCKPGSLVLYRLSSDSFYVHTIIPGSRKSPKFQVTRKRVVSLHRRETCLSVVWTTGEIVFIKNADKIDLESFVNTLESVQQQIANAPPKLASQDTPVRQNSWSTKSLKQTSPLNSNVVTKREPSYQNSLPLDCLSPQVKYEKSPAKNYYTPSYVSPARTYPLQDPSLTKDNSPTGKAVLENIQVKRNSPSCNGPLLSQRFTSAVNGHLQQNQDISTISQQENRFMLEPMNVITTIKGLPDSSESLVQCSPASQKTPAKSSPWLRKPSAKSSRKKDIENQPSKANSSSPKVKQKSKVNSQTRTRRKKLSDLNSTDASPRSSPFKPSSDLFLEHNKPLCDTTHSTDNLSNTVSNQPASVSRFYGAKSRPSYGLWGSRQRPLLDLSFTSSTESVRKSPLLSKTYRKTSSSLFVDNIGDELVPLKGFSNLGNTCYMNAILQSLLGLTTFAHDLSNPTLLKNVHPDCLYKRMYQLLCCKRRNSSMETQRLHLKKFKFTISAAATRFSGYLQHDAHEFLCQVLEQIKDDAENCDPSTTPSKQLSTVQSGESLSPISRNFDCHILHIIRCKECGEQTTKEEIFRDFSLDIPNLCSSNSPQGAAIKIEELIERFFKDEEVEYDCPKCESKEALVSHRITKLPRILILHLKRYGYDRGTDGQAKRKDNISITKSVDIGKLCSPDVVSPLRFELAKKTKGSPSKSQLRNSRPQEIIDITDDSRSTRPVRRRLIKTTDRTHSTPAKQTTKSDSENDLVILSDCDSKPKTRKRLSVDLCNNVSQGNSPGCAKKSKLMDTDSECVVDEKNVSELGEQKLLKRAVDDSKHITAVMNKQKACCNVSQDSSPGCAKNGTLTSTDSVGALDRKNVSELTEEEMLKWAVEDSKHITAVSKKQKARSSSQEVDLSLLISKNDVGRFVSLGSNDKVSVAAEAVESIEQSRGKESGHSSFAASPAKQSEPEKSRRILSGGNSFSQDRSVRKNLKRFSDDSCTVSDRESEMKDSLGFNSDDIARAIAQSLEVQQQEVQADEEMEKVLEMSLHDYERTHGLVPLEECDSGFVSPESHENQIKEIDANVCKSSHEYRLVSVVSHIGRSSTSGHYISDVYDCMNKQWMSYNDTAVDKVTEHEVRYSRCSTGYIFFYQDKQSVESLEQSTALKTRVTNV